MSCRQTNRQTIVEVVYLIVCVCQIDSSRLHCCTCPKLYSSSSYWIGCLSGLRPTPTEEAKAILPLELALFTCGNFPNK
jgi:hypothetical protein